MLRRSFFSVINAELDYPRYKRGQVMGVYKANKSLAVVEDEVITEVEYQTRVKFRYNGKKQYELSNHLGNVLVTISDRRKAICNEADSTLRYEAVVITASDYYSFGSPLIGRTYQAESIDRYRFSINGQEKDDEIYGEGNAMSATFWEYDSRLGRRWNIDPVITIGISDYSCFENNPILSSDPDGKFRIKTNEGRTKAERREERKNLRFITRQLFIEALSWNRTQWRATLTASRYDNKLQYLKNFIPGLGPTLRFSDPGSLADGPGLGDGNGNPVNRVTGSRSAYGTYQGRTANVNGQRTPATGDIVLDEGINRLLSDVKSSSKSGELEGVLTGANPALTGNKANFIRNQSQGARDFSVTVLGHELTHHGAFMTSAPDGNPPFFERGQMFEIGVYGSVRGHTQFGYAVFSSMERRLFTPNHPLLAQRRVRFGVALFGPGF